jgi:hypothetical protein
MHRLFLFSGNKVKGSILKPAYQEKFHVGVDPSITIMAEIPQENTDDVNAKLGELERKVGGLTPWISKLPLTQDSLTRGTRKLQTVKTRSGADLCLWVTSPTSIKAIGAPSSSLPSSYESLSKDSTTTATSQRLLKGNVVFLVMQ